MTAMSEPPAISVVVSSFQRAAKLERLLRALEAQDIAVPFEVVIVDNGSTDDTWETLQRWRDTTPLVLRPVRIEVNRGPSGGRNAGWREARGALVAFTDDDC